MPILFLVLLISVRIEEFKLKVLIRIFGSRILKTGLAVFITAIICQFFKLPSIFAVVTAIVTIEPTVSDSIKKGAIRLPASAIGAGFSMTFASLLGEVPISYALSTICTIMVCHKLKLDAGILVATLTAVTMIPFTTDHFLTAFFTRLGTTSIGLLVSTAVNLFVLPPNYSEKILWNMNTALDNYATLLSKQAHGIINGKIDQIENNKRLFDLKEELREIYKLCNYKKDEWKFHRFTERQERLYHYECEKLSLLQKIHQHCENLLTLQNINREWTEKDKITLLAILHSFSDILRNPIHQFTSNYLILIKEIEKRFFDWKKPSTLDGYNSLDSKLKIEMVLLYEIISLHDVLEQLGQLSISKTDFDRLQVEKKLRKTGES